MQIYIGFDDTDSITSDFGTGKLVRKFMTALPAECRIDGVIRHQLFVSPEIPYTSHNSSACLLARIPDPDLMDTIAALAAKHLAAHAAEGSDPGLCLAAETDSSIDDLMTFGRACTRTVMSQAEAMRAAGKSHLSGHGGSNDGIIGAAAAVGLSAAGWSGRYIELDDLRGFPAETSVSELSARQIAVIPVDRDASVPAPQDRVITNGWLRPRRMAHGAVLLVSLKEPGVWQNLYFKNRKGHGQPAAQATAQ